MALDKRRDSSSTAMAKKAEYMCTETQGIGRFGGKGGVSLSIAFISEIRKIIR